MKLYDFMEVTQQDYDCYDTEQDISVTVCWIDDIESDYDKFCVELLKKVDIVKRTNDYTMVCDWSKVIKDNYDKFKAFTATEWKTDYEDRNEFIYQWIKELHYYVAGEMPEDYYGTLYKFIQSLKVTA